LAFITSAHLGQHLDEQRRSERGLFVADAIKSTAEWCVSRPSAADGAAYVTAPAGEFDRTADAKLTAFCRLLSDGNNRPLAIWWPWPTASWIHLDGRRLSADASSRLAISKPALTASDKMQTQEGGLQEAA
jgi:hypothetical protein